MSWLWIVMGVLAAVAGLRHRSRLARGASDRHPRVDDDAVRRIVAEGRLPATDEEPLDMDEVARAEEEFWNEPWDDPDDEWR